MLDRRSARWMAIGETDLEVPASIEIAKHTLLSAGLILAIGAITGYLVAGFLFCMVQTLPLSEKFLGFEYEVSSSTPSVARA